MVGLDVPSPDRPPYPVHRILLGNGILILENLTGLETLPSDQVFRLYALPLMVEADSAPVRVIAEVPD
jgi:kynurenine formamidase